MTSHRLMGMLNDVITFVTQDMTAPEDPLADPKPNFLGSKPMPQVTPPRHVNFMHRSEGAGDHDLINALNLDPYDRSKEVGSSRSPPIQRSANELAEKFRERRNKPRLRTQNLVDGAMTRAIEQAIRNATQSIARPVGLPKISLRDTENLYALSDEACNNGCHTTAFYKIAVEVLRKYGRTISSLTEDPRVYAGVCERTSTGSRNIPWSMKGTSGLRIAGTLRSQELPNDVDP